MSTSRESASSSASFSASPWRLPLAWAGVILVLTSWPSTRRGGGVAGVDKLGHFVMYGILGFLVARALASPRTRAGVPSRVPVPVRARALVALASMTLFAMLDEVHQRWIPGRDASIADWAADIVGATLGLLVANHLLSLAPKRPEPST